VNLPTAQSGADPSPALEKYLDRQITSSEYFKEVRRETAQQVERELKEASETTSTDE
jgi:TPP-dependent pyruvate/acetoin dehydrogenase alpha subunit